MKYCSKCGSPINEGDSFCRMCGERLVGGQSSNVQVNNNMQQNNSGQMNNNQTGFVQQNKKKKKYWLIPVFVFVLMLGSNLIRSVLSLFEVKSGFFDALFGTMSLICGFAVIPTVILAVVLSLK